MGVVVIGSINMDVVAVTDRHPRAGETVKGSALHLLPGGKGANQAVAACRAGAGTAMYGRVGEDAFAERLVSFLIAEGVDTTNVERVRGAPSGTAVIVVADGENTIAMVPGANDALAPDHVQGLDLQSTDVVVAQLEVPQPTIAAAFEVARRQGGTTVLNAAPAAPCDPRLLAVTDVLVVNETELGRLLGDAAMERARPEQAIEGAARLRRDGQAVIVTLGARGAVAVEDSGALRVDGHAVDVVDTTGAGDCFVGNLAASLERGMDMRSALYHANRAAAVCVQGLGAAMSMPTLERPPSAPRAAA